MRARVAVVLVGLLAVAVSACGDEADPTGTTTGDTASWMTAVTGSTVVAPVEPDGTERDLATMVWDVGVFEGRPDTYTDSQCFAEVLVEILGEDEARAAVAQGLGSVLAALGDGFPALMGEGPPEVKAAVAAELEELSDFCWYHLRLDAKLDVEREVVLEE